MGYAQYGVDDGFPIVSAHGGLACRLDVAAAEPVAVDTGVRLISPDRPGVGLSDPQPGRTILDWAHDVEELLEQIDVDRFAVMGWSMGGQYAAAVGHALRHRVTRVAIIAGALPLTDPGVFGELPAMDRFLTGTAIRAPWLGRQTFRVMRSAARIAPTLYGRMAARDSDRPTVRSSAPKDSTLLPGCHAKRPGSLPGPSRSIARGCARGVSRPKISRWEWTCGRGRRIYSSTRAGRTG
jgi:pimeloyl-ACP methyl ester carboxylesterase